MKRTLTLMAKPPTPGLAKTRLAASIGDDNAAMIAYGLLADTLELCELAAGADETVHLALAYSAEYERFRAMTDEQWQLMQQHEGDLGERLGGALADLAPAEGDATVFIGNDAPHLPVERIAEAFRALEDAGAVLGPCEDGGYYLIGVRGSWPAGTLAAVRWSSEHALADTREALQALGIFCAELAPWYDVDEIDDLRRLARDIEKLPPVRMENTRMALAHLDLD